MAPTHQAPDTHLVAQHRAAQHALKLRQAQAVHRVAAVAQALLQQLDVGHGQLRLHGSRGSARRAGEHGCVNRLVAA
jgi:hypothetical protein